MAREFSYCSHQLGELELLIVSRTSLTAWPLGGIQIKDPHSIRLPGPVMRITAKQNQVGIFTTTYSVLIWSIGGALISVETSVLSDVTDFLLRQGLVVFHPIEQNLFFIIYEAWSKSGRDISTHTRRIIVQEFDEGKLKMTKVLDLLSSSAEPTPITGYLHDGVVGIFKIAVPQSTAERDANTIQTHNRFGENATGGSKSRMFVMATFDVYQRRFVLEDYCLPDSLRGVHHADKALEQALYWRNQVLLPVNDGSPSELKHLHPGKSCKWSGAS